MAGGVTGDLDLTPPPESLVWLAILGVTSQSVGYLLISISLPRLPAVVTSIILLAQPVMTVVLSIVLLGESPSSTQLVGRGAGHRRDRRGHAADRAGCRDGLRAGRAGPRRLGRRPAHAGPAGARPALAARSGRLRRPTSAPHSWAWPAGGSGGPSYAGRSAAGRVAIVDHARVAEVDEREPARWPHELVG